MFPPDGPSKLERLEARARLHMMARCIGQPPSQSEVEENSDAIVAEKERLRAPVEHLCRRLHERFPELRFWTVWNGIDPNAAVSVIRDTGGYCEDVRSPSISPLDTFDPSTVVETRWVPRVQQRYDIPIDVRRLVHDDDPVFDRATQQVARIRWPEGSKTHG